MFRGVSDAPDAALSPTVPLALFALYQMKFAIITPALVSGSFAERVRFSSYLVFISLFTHFVYCPLAHATWHPNGVLHRFGVLASTVSTFAVRWKSQSHLDDTLDVFPCHGVGGMVGMVATGLFASKAVNPAGENGLIFGGTTLFLKHLAALVAVSLFASVGSWIIYAVTDRIRPLRVLPAEEKLGLDITQHGETLHDDPRSSMVPGA